LRITHVTPEAAAWCGGTVAELIGVHAPERCPAPPEFNAAVEAALGKGVASVVVYESLIVPGRWVEADVRPVKGGACAWILDVTSRVLAERSLRSPEAIGLDAAPVEIVLLNDRGIIVAANAAWRAAVAALGLNQTDAGVGAPYTAAAEAMAERTDPIALQARLEELFCGRLSMFEATYSQKSPEGPVRRQARVAPIHIRGETYFVAMHQDLAERARILGKLHETSEQLLYAQEAERQRIAIELHDSTSQHLAGLVLSLGGLRGQISDAAALAVIDRLDKLAQQAAQETRVLAYLLNASSRVSEGLELSARRFVEGFGRRTQLRTSFEARGHVDAVDAAAQHAMFRVIQEALTNVYRHAGATQADVSLANDAGCLVLQVADDGKGMGPSISETAEVPLGVGIAGMRARIEQLGGRLEIKNGLPGTVVSARIPLG
jgi:signal transduction histidine kinase